MGRSQLQYRRGRGRGVGPAGRGERVPAHLRNLESNAYRFQEEETVDENELEDDADEPPTAGKRDLRYNPDIQHMPASTSTGGIGYFQSKTEREWEADLEAMKPNDVSLDFKAIGDHLNTLPPATRYGIDPKFCIDLAFEAPTSPVKSTLQLTPTPTVAVPTAPVASVAKPAVAAAPQPATVVAKPAVPVLPNKPVVVVAKAMPPPTHAALDDELDELLNM
ncbi:hypothetical protein SPRG_08491 [Saprolegnia parasitica CBS 223.65]|uniref:Uncharacterized protein n=1 Tax=Saprolegnia parasitica (strain CBS 223.65) TaxID=695850 RepID=A0A067CAC6_SAPPC|nr:hypothetical protein SPRG_08491 [Saprolegnia parasitica CBS 223.65]KDO26130.1 hypothetical protein SPRG_08491 [Saprolegnia parasitica CBS 223.65]|eukprot:XP_012203124.1 hypothetical protein SPRG_08491 [Saprolegnia parasitica CBS 223.65]